jgi:serine O-acetyltransferase
MPVTGWDECKRLVRSDLYRYGGRTDTGALVRSWLTVPGFQYTATMRVSAFALHRGRVARTLAHLALRRYEARWGITIPPETEVGEGLFIAHHGGIVVNPGTRIGRNVNLQHGVTIGQSNRGRRAGAPVIGDGVWIGPGACVIGAITVGDNAAIGANCVVVEDVPANAVLAPAPTQTLSTTRGAAGLSDAPVEE